MLANNKEYDLQRDILSRYPLSDYLVSEKLDGIRCLVTSEGICSRSFKPIPNKFVNDKVREYVCSTLHGNDILDTELLCYNEAGERQTFHETQSQVMSEDGEPRFLVNAFDMLNQLDTRYQSAEERFIVLADWYYRCGRLYCTALNAMKFDTIEKLDAYHDGSIAHGGEGLMLRHRLSKYKCGRATLREASLLKYVRYTRITCVIVDMKEAMENIDTSCKKKENLFGKGTLGSLVVRCPGEFGDATFGVGTGWDSIQAQYMWDHPTQYIGKHIEVSYKPHGTKDVPRQPVFVGMRPECD